jgi:hypothetical protein
VPDGRRAPLSLGAESQDGRLRGSDVTDAEAGAIAWHCEAPGIEVVAGPSTRTGWQYDDAYLDV